MSMTIALVDDDRNILASPSAALSVALQSEGFVTRLSRDGEAAPAPPGGVPGERRRCR